MAVLLTMLRPLNATLRPSSTARSNDLLHTVDIGGKGSDNDALVPRPCKQVAHTGGHLLLRSRKTGALGIGRVAEQGQDPLLSVLRQGRQIR